MDAATGSRINLLEQVPARFTPEQVSSIASSIRSHYHHNENPPADDIFVSHRNIRRDPNDDKFVLAQVKLTVDYCGEKTHRFTIRVRVTSRYDAVMNTMSYANYV